MTLPPWQPPESISPLGWYAIWGILALVGLALFYYLHPLRQSIRMAAGFMRDHPRPWLILSAVGVAAALLELAPLRGAGTGGANQQPEGASVPSALTEGFSTSAQLFYYPINSWPLSLVLAGAILCGWRRAPRRLWDSRGEAGPVWGSVALVAVAVCAVAHLLYRLDPLLGWLPEEGSIHNLSRPGSRLFEILIALCLQAYLFLAVAQRLDANPKALLADRWDLVLSRVLRLFPLALVFLLAETWLDRLEEFRPATATILNRWVWPEILLILCPLPYILVFSREHPRFLAACSAALDLLLQIRFRVLWFLLFSLTLTTLLHYIAANAEVAAEGVWSYAWRCLEPLLRVCIGVWLLATWFIVLQLGVLPVLAGREDTPAGNEGTRRKGNR